MVPKRDAATSEEQKAGAIVPGAEAFQHTVLKRLAVLEAERAVRNVLAKYVALCDEPCTESGSLAELFSTDAVWEGVGPFYADKFGRIDGRDKIVTFLNTYLGSGKHFIQNAHFLTTDSVHVDEYARTASGQWMMLQVSTYSKGGAEIIGARLRVSFAIDGDAWKITSFVTERLTSADWIGNAGTATVGGAQ